MTVITEVFKSDTALPDGTVVTIGGTAEIIACSNGDRVVGVVSGSDQNDVTVVIKGRTQIKCELPVNKGDRLVASDNGRARVTQSGHPDIFAIALESSRAGGWGRDLVPVWVL
jgi:alkylated DNA nucleotide flippase Atl1